MYNYLQIYDTFAHTSIVSTVNDCTHGQGKGNAEFPSGRSTTSWSIG